MRLVERAERGKILRRESLAPRLEPAELDPRAQRAARAAARASGSIEAPFGIRRFRRRVWTASAQRTEGKITSTSPPPAKHLICWTFEPRVLPGGVPGSLPGDLPTGVTACREAMRRARNLPFRTAKTCRSRASPACRAGRGASRSRCSLLLQAPAKLADIVHAERRLLGVHRPSRPEHARVRLSLEAEPDEQEERVSRQPPELEVLVEAAPPLEEVVSPGRRRGLRLPQRAGSRGKRSALARRARSPRRRGGHRPPHLRDGHRRRRPEDDRHGVACGRRALATRTRGPPAFLGAFKHPHGALRCALQG